MMQHLVQPIKRSPRLYSFLRYSLYARWRSLNRQKVFNQIYQDNYWDGTSSVSGPGSSLDATESLRQEIPGVITQLGAKSFLDIPCGDFQWMRHVQLNDIETYIGADIVPSLIQSNQENYGDVGHFVHLDLLRSPLPQSDIVFCRDCLVHLSFREIYLVLENIKKSNSKYLITTTFPGQLENADTVPPYWRALNLEKAPFNLPTPITLLKDFSSSQSDAYGKHLGVWRIQELPILF